MRLAAIVTVFDSADVIEMLVRHTIRLVDRIYVHDDGSPDASVEILGRLRAEGFDIVVSAGESGAFYQRRVTRALIARALEDEAWDFLVILDDDEFLTAADRATLEADLAAVPAGHVPALSVRHHVLSAADDPSEAHPLRRMRRAVEWWPRPFKMIAPGPLMRRPDSDIIDGNHAIKSAGEPVPWQVLPRVRIAHFPIRSADQSVSRTCLMYVRSKLRVDYDPELNEHRIRIAGALRRLPALAVPAEILQAIGQQTFFRVDETGLVEAPFDAGHAVRRHADLAIVRPYDRLLHAADGAIAQCRALRGEVARLEAQIAALAAENEALRVIPEPPAPPPVPRKNAASRAAHRLRWFLRRRRRACRAKTA